MEPSYEVVNQSENLKSQIIHNLAILKCLWDDCTLPGMIVRQTEVQFKGIDFKQKTVREYGPV